MDELYTAFANVNVFIILAIAIVLAVGFVIVLSFDSLTGNGKPSRSGARSNRNRPNFIVGAFRTWRLTYQTFRQEWTRRRRIHRNRDGER